MSLTAAQAARLFAIPADVCQRVFDELVQAGVLCRKWEGRYVTLQLPALDSAARGESRS